MDVKTSHLKLFVVLFILFVVVGAGLSIRSNSLAGANADDCKAQTGNSFEQQVDAISPAAMQNNVTCEN